MVDALKEKNRTTNSSIMFPEQDKLSFLFYSQIASTNEEAFKLIDSGYATTGTVLVAEEQLHGKGTGNKKWASPKGNLYTSIILYTDIPISKVSLLSFVFSLAVHSTISELYSKYLPGKTQNIFAKWPNDILVNNKKISGILIESRSNKYNPNIASSIVVGIGINNLSAPTNTFVPATCLTNEGVIGVENNELLGILLKQSRFWYNLFYDKGLPIIKKHWLQRAYKLGEDIQIVTPKGEIQGRFISVNNSGQIILDVQSEKMIFASGTNTILIKKEHTIANDDFSKKGINEN